MPTEVNILTKKQVEIEYIGGNIKIKVKVSN